VTDLVPARARRLVVWAALAIGAVLSEAHAAEKPLWEAGIGLGGLWLPDYRGSNESRGYVLPIPYLIYRGDILKADREGVRAEFLDTDRVRFEFAVNASQPVRSSSNEARQGMPDLKGSFEAGPALVVNLARSDDRTMKLDFRLPVSTGVTLGSGFKGIGWQTSPRLNLDVFDVAGQPGVNLGIAAGPIFQNRKRDAYFYDVSDEYVRPGRAAYRSQGGYAGAQFLAALSKRFDRYWVGGFVRADSLRGATFDDSPLVRKKSYFAAGVGFAWVFGQSTQMVDVAEDR
jgi:outer membrane scaffolding protein for murein synthesis (MipA/OmpV family)